jgi:hypothetical protein
MNNVATLAQSPYYPGPATADFELSPSLKSALKRRRICDDNDITNNATEELKRLSQNGFKE